MAAAGSDSDELLRLELASVDGCGSLQGDLAVQNPADRLRSCLHGVDRSAQLASHIETEATMEVVPIVDGAEAGVDASLPEGVLIMGRADQQQAIVAPPILHPLGGYLIRGELYAASNPLETVVDPIGKRGDLLSSRLDGLAVDVLVGKWCGVDQGMTPLWAGGCIASHVSMVDDRLPYD